MQQHQELRHDVLYLVGDEYLAGVELDLIPLHLKVRLELREVKYAGEVEGIVHIQVYPEQRVFAHRVQFPVEGQVILILQVRRLLCPDGRGSVDDVVHLHVLPLLLAFLILAIFLMLRAGAELDGHRQKLRILVQDALNAVLFQKLLAVGIDVQDYVRAALRAGAV